MENFWCENVLETAGEKTEMCFLYSTDFVSKSSELFRFFIQLEI